jgi:hypothetical protein
VIVTPVWGSNNGFDQRVPVKATAVVQEALIE